MNTKIKDAKLNKKSKSNSRNDRLYKTLLYIFTFMIAALIVFSIIVVFARGIKVINDNNVSWSSILFGNQVNPGAGILSGGILIFNTLWLALLAILIAAPIAIGISIFITKILPKRISTLLFSIVAILAAIPSVVYGAFGYYVMDPFSVNKLGLENASLFTMVIMVAFMIMPTITIMTIASIRMNDVKAENSSYALGANKTQTSVYITIRMARTGIFVGILFAVGRCLAETTAISMVGSPSSADGVTIALWKQSLFLGPALLSANNGEIHGPFPTAPLIAMFLLTTTMLLFAAMKFAEFKSSEDNVVKKQNKINSYQNKILEKYNSEGIASLSAKEQSILIKIDRMHEIKLRQDEYYNRPEISAQKLLQRSTISSSLSFEKYKSNKSKLHYSFMGIFTFFGIALLAGIFIFLFNGGFKHLDWETLTSRDSFGINGELQYGAAIPMMGTLITVLISLVITVPIGTILGMCLSTYLNKSKKSGWLASYIFQALTSIPSIVWSTIALAIFAGTKIEANAVSLEPILFLCLVILPSVIKSVEEAGGRVKRNQIEGSYALGASVLTTTRRVYIREITPAIISGALLAVSIAMAESTIFIAILPSTTSPENMSEWFSNGGTTLATAIFEIRNTYPITNYPESLNYIKTFGIILMTLILLTSYISTLIGNKKIIEALLLGITLIITPLGFYIGHGSIIILTIALITLISGLVIVPIIRKVMRK